jgi:hypothetical protein
MKKSIIGIALVVILIIAIAGGFAVWQSGILNSPAASPTPSPPLSATPTATASPTPSDSTQQQVRDAAITYIESSHPEAALYMQSLTWSGGRVETGRVGAENYEYTTLTSAPGSAGWTVTINYPVVPNPIYTVTANYTQTGVQTPVNISWEGTWQNGTITETTYLSNVNEALAPQEQARDDVMIYIRTHHVETAQFMTSLTWTGGRINTGLLGAEKYVYNSNGWTVSIQYPVVLNPIYTINATYISPVSEITPEQAIFAWQGTWQKGSINETSFTNAQLLTQEQVRDAAMNYIRTNHADAVPYAQNLTWTGGRATPEGLVGSETYTYFSTGWNVTMQYPVVPNAIYKISADYSAPSTEPSIPIRVIWEGTWQNGTITETNYTFAQ